MNDEINREVANKTVALVFRASKLTTNTLAKAMKAYLNHGKQKSAAKQRAAPNHGKMSVKELVGQGQGATSIEVTSSNIKAFEKIAKKYNVDFAVKKDKTVDPPKYTVFFKAKDTDVISSAFKEFVKVNEKKRTKVSLRQRLNFYKRIVAQNKNRERTREKQKNRGHSL
jgi:hypothetical protein